MHGNREAREAEQRKTRSSNEKEHAMMFAIALALIGIIVLKSLEHVAANA